MCRTRYMPTSWFSGRAPAVGTACPTNMGSPWLSDRSDASIARSCGRDMQVLPCAQPNASEATTKIDERHQRRQESGEYSKHPRHPATLGFGAFCEFVIDSLEQQREHAAQALRQFEQA